MEFEPNARAETEAALRGALTQANDDLRYQELLIQEANHSDEECPPPGHRWDSSVQANKAANVIIRDALEAGDKPD